VDLRTLAAYDAAAPAFAAEWHEQPAPTDLHDLVRRFFELGRTADVGSGSGREVAWLAANGFDAVGYEPSRGLRAEAQRRYPALCFTDAALPDLAGIVDASFDNVLCETVLMHLDLAQIGAAVTRLASILKPGGTLYLSWRVTEGSDQRDAQGRLYAAFEPELVRRALANTVILLDEARVSTSSGKKIQRIVARKPADASA
jgi:SAM-dependent methyltransferase